MSIPFVIQLPSKNNDTIRFFKKKMYVSCDMSIWLLQGLKYNLEKIFAIPIHMQKEAS